MDAALKLVATLPAMGFLGFLRWLAQKCNIKGFGIFRLSLSNNSSVREAPAPVQLTVLKRSRLTPNHQLHLVIAMDQQILLCTHPQGCSIVPLVSKPDPAAVTNT
jgi:hypothetical protein